MKKSNNTFVNFVVIYILDNKYKSLISNIDG